MSKAEIIEDFPELTEEGSMLACRMQRSGGGWYGQLRFLAFDDVGR